MCSYTALDLSWETAQIFAFPQCIYSENTVLLRKIWLSNHSLRLCKFSNSPLRNRSWKPSEKCFQQKSNMNIVLNTLIWMHSLWIFGIFHLKILLIKGNFKTERKQKTIRIPTGFLFPSTHHRSVTLFPLLIHRPWVSMLQTHPTWETAQKAHGLRRKTEV